MKTVRCYLPLSGQQLEQLRRERALSGALTATAVTDAVRAALEPEADEEEAEHVAAQLAAEHLVLEGRPVVLAAADVASETVTMDQGPWVQVSGITLPRVAALYLGDDVVGAAGEPVPDPAEELVLSWFDTTELDDVIALAVARPSPSAPTQN